MTVIMMAAVIVGTATLLLVGFLHNGTVADRDLVKIECLLHRDNADVHKLCVDRGYDD